MGPDRKIKVREGSGVKGFGLDLIPDPQDLTVRTRVSGELMQRESTAKMIFPVARLIEFLSTDTTLLAGTVILTGTPSGIGFTRTPRRTLEHGDRVEIEIDGIGRLSNPVVDTEA